MNHEEHEDVVNHEGHEGHEVWNAYDPSCSSWLKALVLFAIEIR